MSGCSTWPSIWPTMGTRMITIRATTDRARPGPPRRPHQRESAADYRYENWPRRPAAPTAAPGVPEEPAAPPRPVPRCSPRPATVPCVYPRTWSIRPAPRRPTGPGPAPAVAEDQAHILRPPLRKKIAQNAQQYAGEHLGGGAGPAEHLAGQLATVLGQPGPGLLDRVVDVLVLDVQRAVLQPGADLSRRRPGTGRSAWVPARPPTGR